MKKKRLSMNLTEQMHKDIKIRAANRNINITKWILQAIIEKLTQEDQYNELPPLS